MITDFPCISHVLALMSTFICPYLQLSIHVFKILTFIHIFWYIIHILKTFLISLLNIQHIEHLKTYCYLQRIYRINTIFVLFSKHIFIYILDLITIPIILFVWSLYNKYQYFYPQDLDHIQDLRHFNIFESV